MVWKNNKRRQKIAYIPLGEAVIHSQILNPRSKAFIEPQVSPPFLHGTSLDLVSSITAGILEAYHCHKIAKPLVSQLVAYYEGHPLLCRGR